MTTPRWLAFAVVLAVGCAKEAGDTDVELVDDDYDGFYSDVDCDDKDPYVHPGAAEAAGDGIDADCDGVDGTYPYVGDYNLTYLMAGFSGFPILAEGTESGTLTIDDNLYASMALSTELDEEAVGFSIPVDLELGGDIVPHADPNAFMLEATGIWRDEEVFVNWDCAFEGSELSCFGALKLLGYGFENEADFEAAR